MEKKPSNTIHALHQPDQGTSDDCNSATPLSRPPASLHAVVPTVFNTSIYDELLDNDTLYSVYSPRRSNSPPVLIQGKTYEDLMRSEYDIEVHAALLAQQLSRSHMTDRYDRIQEPLAATILGQYNSKALVNPYGFDLNIPSQESTYDARHHIVASVNSCEFDLNIPNYSSQKSPYKVKDDNVAPVNPYEFDLNIPKFSSQESIYGSLQKSSYGTRLDNIAPVNPYGFDLNIPSNSSQENSYEARHDNIAPVNSYGFDLNIPYNPSQENSYGARHDNVAAKRDIKQDRSFSCSKVPINPSFAGDKTPVNNKFSIYGQNSEASATPKLYHEGNRCSMLLDLVSDTENLFETMQSKHGNYTFQRLLALSDEEQKKDIVVRVSKDPRRLVDLATDEFGQLSFNKLVDEVSTSPNLSECLMLALSSELLDLMIRPQNGPAVIKYLLGHLHPNSILPIFEAALEHFYFLSRDKPGYLSLNYCFSKLYKFDYQETTAKDYKWLLLMKLIDNSIELATDEFGNFVIQHVIRLGISEYTYMICNKLKDNVHQLSLSKPGSFVLQTCLESSGRMIILHALKSYDFEILHQITMHPYGNYVMQSAMNVSTELPPDDNLLQAMQQFPANINGRNRIKRK